MRRNSVTLKLGAMVAIMSMASAPARAAKEVVDHANLAIALVNKFANEASAVSNAASNIQLEVIRRALEVNEEGTVIHNTTNIDNSIKYNTVIDNDFTWNIYKPGEEIIPIPFKENFKKVMNGQNVTAYSSHYKTLSQHEADPLGHYGDETAMEASRARKAANVALVEAITHDESALAREAETLRGLGDLTRQKDGHGHQLQIANALAGTQASQLMRLRAMMLVSESARAAESQAAADREARAVAVGKRLRNGLEKALEQSVLPSPAY